MRVFSPAKLNLSLAVTGRRADGFHELVSVAAPLVCGDELEAETMADGRMTLSCAVPGVPVDESNLVLRAARLFAEETGWRGGVRFRLHKRIPMGAGLGGGSSNAVAALRALQQLVGIALEPARLAALAAKLGSDCAMFLHEAPVVMRGRGERVEALPSAAAARLRGRRVLVAKPSFGVATAWAYGRMAERGDDHVSAVEAEARLATWLAGAESAEGLLANNMEPAVFAKFVALPALLAVWQREAGLVGRMSGSGSACFVLLREETEAAPLRALVREAWGEAAWMEETRLA